MEEQKRKGKKLERSRGGMGGGERQDRKSVQGGEKIEKRKKISG